MVEEKKTKKEETVPKEKLIEQGTVKVKALGPYKILGYNFVGGETYNVSDKHIEKLLEYEVVEKI